MTKKTSVTLPDTIYRDLDRWAKAEGRPTANLMAFLLEQAVRVRFPERYASEDDRQPEEGEPNG